jgi:hypothetical protein
VLFDKVEDYNSFSDINKDKEKLKKIFENDNSFYYLETKGYEIPNDQLKWKAVKEAGHKLEIWFDEEISGQISTDFFHKKPTAYSKFTKSINEDDLF